MAKLFEMIKDIPVDLGELKKYLNAHSGAIREKDARGYTAMHYAAELGQAEVIDLLRIYRGEVNAYSSRGITPLLCAARNRHIGCILTLLTNNADPLCTDQDEMNIFHYMVLNGHSLEEIKAVQDKLTAYQWQHLLKAVDNRGRTLLHLAAEPGNQGVFSFLIDEGLDDINHPDHCDYTPLHNLARNGHLQTAHFLLEKGANPFTLNINGDNVFHQALHFGKCQFATELHRATLIREFTDIEDHLIQDFNEAYGYIANCHDAVAFENFNAQDPERSNQDFDIVKKAFIRNQTNQANMILENLLPQIEYQHPQLTCYAFVMISDIHLLQEDYQRAMIYAAAACAYYADQVDQPYKVFQHRLEDQVVRTITNYRQKKLYQSDALPPLRLSHYRQCLIEHRQRMRRRIYDESEIMAGILKDNTDFFISLTADLIQDAMRFIGHYPPCYYAAVGLGSMGRGEMSLFSDLEFAFLISRSNETNIAYFSRLAEVMQLLVIGLGETPLNILSNGYSPTLAGFHFDDGGNTPLNLEFIGTPEKLADLQRRIDLDANIIARNAMRTVQFIDGNKRLLDIYDRLVWNILTTRLNTEQSFGGSLLSWFRGKKRYCCQQEAINVMKGDLKEFNPHHMAQRKHERNIYNFNVKSELYRLPSQTIANLALFYKIPAKKTWDRLRLLHENNRISTPAYQRLSEIMEIVTRLRLKAHLYYGYEEESLYHSSMVEPLIDTRRKAPYTLDDATVTKLAKLYQTLLPLYDTLAVFIHEFDEGSDLNGKRNPFRTAPLCDDGIITRALAYERLCKPEEAQKCYLQAMQLNPNNLELHVNQLCFINKQLLNMHQIIDEGAQLQQHWIFNMVMLLSKKKATETTYQYFYAALPKKDQQDFLKQIKEYIKDPNILEAIDYKIATDSAEITKNQCDQFVSNLREQPDLSLFVSVLTTLDNCRRPTLQILESMLNKYQLLLQHQYLHIAPSVYFFGLQLLDRVYEKRIDNLLEQQKTLTRSLSLLIKVLIQRSSEIESYRQVYAKLPISIRQNFRQQLLVLAEEEKQYDFIYTILRELNIFPDESGNRYAWEQSKQHWKKVFKSLVTGPSQPGSQSIRITSPLLNKPYDLAPEVQQTLFEGKKKFREQTINDSTHQVIPLITELGQFYVKANPEMPGMTYLMEQLHQRLVGHGTCFGELIRLDIPGKKEPIPVLMSQGVPGPTLHTVLAGQPELLKKLDHRHFTELAFVAMLTNPEDGIPNNFIVQEIDNGNLTLISVDHDHALFPAYLVRRDPHNNVPKQELQIKTILFCLDNMLKPVDTLACENFLALNPAKTLRAVLRDAQEQNQHYQQLFDEQTIQRFYRKRKGGNTAIPIPIKSGDIAKIYHKMIRLQNLLRLHPQMTLLQCLLQIEPRAGLVYQKVLHEEDNPLTRLQIVGNYPTNVKGELITHTRALKTLMLQSSLLQVEDYYSLKDLRPEEGLAELDRLAYQEEQLAQIRDQVQQGDFNQFQQLLAPEHKELILNGQPEKNLPGINIAQLTTAQQYVLIQSLIGTSMHRLMLANCSVLTPQNFQELLNASPDLLELDLTGQQALADEHIIYISQNCRTLQRLIIKNTQQLNFVRGEFLELNQLTIDNSSVVDIDIEAPKLEILRARNCQNLRKTRTQSQWLNYLDLRDCVSLDDEGICGVANTNYQYQQRRLQTLLLEGATRIVHAPLLQALPFLISMELTQQPEYFLENLHECMVNILTQHDKQLSNLTVQQRQKCLYHRILHQQIQRLLCARLSDDDINVRIQAAKVISKLGSLDTDLLDRVIGGLADDNTQVTTCLVESLAELGKSIPNILTVLTTALRHPHHLIRLNVEKCLIKLNQFNSKTITYLTANLKDSSGEVRRYAAQALGEIQTIDEAVIAGLIASFEDLLEEVRTITRESLVRHIQNHHDYLDLLLTAAQDSRRAVSEQAIMALGQVGIINETVASTLNHLIENGRTQQREQVVKAFIQLGTFDYGIRQTLEKALTDVSLKVRVQSAKAFIYLNEINDNLLSILEEGLKTREWSGVVQREAIEGLTWALAERPSLLSLLKDILIGNPGSLINKTIITYITDHICEYPHWTELLIICAGDTNVAIKLKALEGLAKISHQQDEALDILLNGLNDSEESIRAFIKQALVELCTNHQHVLSKIQNIIATADGEIAVALSTVLVSLGTTDTAVKQCLLNTFMTNAGELKNMAVMALSQFKEYDDEIFTYLFDALTTQPKTLIPILEAALVAIVQQDARYQTRLLDTMASADVILQASIVRILGNLAAVLNPNDTIPYLESIFTQVSAPHRIDAVKALLQYGILSDEIMVYLIEATNSEHPTVRATTASAMGNLGPLPSLLTRLLELSLSAEADFNEGISVSVENTSGANVVSAMIQRGQFAQNSLPETEQEAQSSHVETIPEALIDEQVTSVVIKKS